MAEQELPGGGRRVKKKREEKREEEEKSRERALCRTRIKSAKSGNWPWLPVSQPARAGEGGVCVRLLGNTSWKGVAVFLSPLRSLVVSVLDEKFSAASKSLYLFLLPLHQLSFIVQP